ncbi:MAG TPA: DUF3618 domain-containing protein [Actinomycetota bacterium]|nr:DUF3618 domain-containing protein [Actinomycetota bacterium]
MDTEQDRGAEAIRIAQIRADIEGARQRIVETIDALEYKADLSARLGGVLSSTASGIASRVLGRIPSTPDGGVSSAAETPVETRTSE